MSSKDKEAVHKHEWDTTYSSDPNNKIVIKYWCKCGKESVRLYATGYKLVAVSDGIYE